MRRQLMKMRIMQTNALRGLLYEFGIALPVGHAKLLQSIQGELAAAQQHNRLPDIGKQPANLAFTHNFPPRA